MATIFDIAKKAGVSITTVSRALNGYSDVSEKTRQRINQIAEELNYYPSAAARSLQGKRTNTIAFAPRLNRHAEAEPFFKEFIGVLSMACLDHDLSLLVTVADAPENTDEVYRELAGSGRVDGFILSDIEPEDARVFLLRELGVPFVAFGRTSDYASFSYPFVDVDGMVGIETVVDYLYRQGHHRIAYVNGTFNTSCAFHRYDGYRAGLNKYGLEEDKRLVLGNLRGQAETKAAVAGLLALPENERPTAIIASNDWLALNVLYTVEECGLTVGRRPGQIAVTGFDDLPFTAFLRPSLTTLKQPLEKVCATLLDLLVTLLRNKDEATLENDRPDAVWLGPRQVLLHPELVVRNSA